MTQQEQSDEKPPSTDEFGILQVMPCHKADVRCVSSFPDGSLLTGSRDFTAKLFKPDEPNKMHSELSEIKTFTAATNFVSSICYGRTKSGEIRIYIGSHDNNIYIYRIDDDEPINILTGHSGPVSALAFRICGDQDILVSGGWDSMAKVWENQVSKYLLSGHHNPVWDVAFVARAFILTAGADKTIRKWSVSDGQLVNVLSHHTDCVRGLAVINTSQFLSCSNDQTVILWSMDGDVLKTFEGHENFIYSVCVIRDPIPKGSEPPKSRPYKFVSVSEDKTVRIWDKDLGCVQKIPLQAVTLWSVAALDNGNFAVGTSEGLAYVFSKVLPNLTESSTPGISSSGQQA